MIRRQTPDFFSYLDYLNRKLERLILGPIRKGSQVTMMMSSYELDGSQSIYTKESFCWGDGTTFIVDRIYNDTCEVVSLGGVRFLAYKDKVYPIG